MSVDAGPPPAVMQRVEALYAALAGDAAFARLRRLMEVDWSAADATVEDLGLPRLMRHEAHKLAAVLAGAEGIDWADVADAIRYTERHDALAQDALWWLGQLASNPSLRT